MVEFGCLSSMFVAVTQSRRPDVLSQAVALGSGKKAQTPEFRV